jgi:hypothetical protein
MRISTLLARNLKWYWRTNLAVLLGVATAAAVLGGALLVGDSVRASLRDLVLARLGNTSTWSRATDSSAKHLAASFGNAARPIAINGMVMIASRRAGGAPWASRSTASRTNRGTGTLSAALARRTGREAGRCVILIRVEKPSAIPLESLHGRKDDVGKTIRA